MSVTDHTTGVSSRPLTHALLNPWVAFFALIAAAWVALLAAAERHDQWHADTSLGGHAVVFGMWALMSVAMMAPTAVPMLRTYRDLVDRPHIGWQRAGFAAIAAGYCTVWVGFSVLAAALQHGLAHAGFISGAGVSTSTWLTVGLLAGAGIYQFAAMKQSCLNECRAPLPFFIAEWRDGPRGAFAMGIIQGIVCVGCCWALMLAAFVGGAMNLLWMGAATVLMIIEKLPSGRVITRPLGIGLIAAAVGVALAALL